jgi:hypothetical protein
MDAHQPSRGAVRTTLDNLGFDHRHPTIDALPDDVATSGVNVDE